METMPPITISSVLREAVESKVEELDQAKKVFNKRYDLDARRCSEIDAVKRLKLIIKDLNKFDPELCEEDELDITARYIEQAEHDRSVSKARLTKLEEQIWSKVDFHRNRLAISSFHASLMKEAMDAGVYDATSRSGATTELDDFEVVENELDEILERFEKETFSTEDVDVEAIETYLSSFFVDRVEKRHLEEIRDDLNEFGEDLLTDGMDIDQDFLMWCITDLLKSDRVSEDKKRTLEGYLQSPVVLRELMATISAKSIRYWDFKDAEKGLPVTARQNTKGHCIVAEECLIDMLFLHAMGIGWAMKLQKGLEAFGRHCPSFAVKPPTPWGFTKREYYLGRTSSGPDIVPNPTPASTCICGRTCTVCQSVSILPPAPMPPPHIVHIPPPPPPQVMVINGHRKCSSRRKSEPWWPIYLPPPPPKLPVNSLKNIDYVNNFFMSRLPEQQGCTPKSTSLEVVQAELIKTLAVEAKLRAALGEGIDASSVYFESLASSLPHKTILTVLKYLGVPEMMIEFFQRFLSAKLNTGPAVRGASDRVLRRARGVPEGHALELFFTEAIMFFLELSVRQNTGNYLYRIGDYGYYVEPFEADNSCGRHIDEFASIMGLNATFALEQEIGLVNITTSGLVLENDKIAAYAGGIKKRLSTCTTVLEWVRVWNSTAGTYAAHLFGPLAEIFGKPHLDAVKSAYNTIFDIVLDGQDLTTYVTNLLTSHLSRPLPNPPFAIDALIYLPQAYGGLGVLNPFVTMNLAHDLPADPDAPITEYIATEDAYYQRAAEHFAQLPPDAHTRKLEKLFNNDPTRIESALGANHDPNQFISKEDLFATRAVWGFTSHPFPQGPTSQAHSSTPCFSTLYQTLLREPIDELLEADKIVDEVRRLAGKGDMKSWNRLSAEEKWVLQMYGDECFDVYGGLEMWCSEFVPLEILKAVRGTGWDEDGEDGSSVSDMTEP
ncbi:hypothetical protein BKA63DRAFT_501997 [Paraphoma chrysanthemicola]|nr:hypothetical protein BKA63DRAFT_501997 [Paraphoma chrysanthemicola]